MVSFFAFFPPKNNCLNFLISSSFSSSLDLALNRNSFSLNCHFSKSSHNAMTFLRPFCLRNEKRKLPFLISNVFIFLLIIQSICKFVHKRRLEPLPRFFITVVTIILELLFLKTSTSFMDDPKGVHNYC